MDIETGVLLSDSWLTYKFDLAKGTHKLEWLYRKINEYDVSDDLSAEIELIEIRGTNTFNKECQACPHGVSNAQKTRCQICEKNEYLQIQNNNSNVCKKCPPNAYSSQGSIGEASCVKRSACTISDYTFTLGECLKNTRMLNFLFIEPKICSDEITGAIGMPESTLVPCRGCGRGEYRKESGECLSCQDGFFQDKDNHVQENESMITTCTECPAGHYAPKMLDLGHFESMPYMFSPFCSIATNIGSTHHCSVSKGWHTDTNLALASNGEGEGIPQGLKLSLKTFLMVSNTSGGRMMITYKMQNFSNNEYFKITVNGMLQFSRNIDTQKL